MAQPSTVEESVGDVERLKPPAGARPECFKSTLVEVLYILTCTMSIAMQALLVGSVTVVTNEIATDLHMTQAEYVQTSL